MDGVSEDFSGLPEYKSRGERRSERQEQKFSRHRSNPHRGHRTRVLLAGGFVLGLLLVATSLIVLFAPTPYLGTSHSALANSVGGSSAQDCRPSAGSWICGTESGGSIARYEVKVDWAGCWTGELIGRAPAGSDAKPAISGCVAIIDHLTAD